MNVELDAKALTQPILRNSASRTSLFLFNYLYLSRKCSTC
uniref:Uncharacterized protein n=1 Tax=Rhizophora mucronata TaxID=61149 RepID=A0A2P2IZI5_RHIMU